MIGLLLAGTAALALLAPRRRADARTPIYGRHAVGACCGQCAAAQAAGTMPYGHTCTPCGASRICPVYTDQRVDQWLRVAASQGRLGEPCVAACDAIQPLVHEALQDLHQTDGYGDPIDWSRVAYDGSPLDQLRARVTTHMLAGCGVYADMSQARAWTKEGKPR